MKKLLVIIALVIAIFSLELVGTYGLYESGIDFTVNAEVATWNVYVNDVKARGEDVSFVIDNYIVNNTSNVREGVFAPTSSMYFDIVVDTNKVKKNDVSVRYDISLDLSNIDNDSIVLDSISLVDEEDDKLIKTGSDVYTGIINLDKDKHDVRFMFKWNNNDDNSENDYNTSLLNELDIPVHVMVSQYLGEDISEYIEEE